MTLIMVLMKFKLLQVMKVTYRVVLTLTHM